MQLDTRTLGFPNSLNATTVGVRIDSGYRFGSLHGGAFIEPLATISVAGPISTASHKAATRSRSTTKPMSKAGLACA